MLCINEESFILRDLSLPSLQAFASVARHGGFRRAANELGMSPSALSRAVSLVEQRLGTRLLNRTTRSVAVTPAGERLLQRLGPALEELGAALDEASEENGAAPHGILRLNASRLAVTTVLGQRLPGFTARYPDIEVDVTVDDDGRDVVGRGFDATIRLGRWIEGDMIGRPVGPRLRRALAAAPSYLREHGTPRDPGDLATHECLLYRINPSGRPLRWDFTGHPEVDPHGRIASGDFELILDAALGGAGLIYVAEPLLRSHLDAGRLVPLLEAWWHVLPPMSVFYSSRRQMPGALRAFIDYLRDGARKTVA